MELIFESKDRKDNTPLLIAIKRGLFPISTYLLEKGANPQVRDSKGRTTLYRATDCGYNLDSHGIENAIKLAKALLQAGVDINAQDNKGRIPLSNAAECIKSVELLLSEGADPTIADNLGKLPVDYTNDKARPLLQKKSR